MVDAVWIVSVFLSMLAIVVTILSLRRKDTEEEVAKPKESQESSALSGSSSGSSGGGGGGRSLEFSPDELDRCMARLTGVVFAGDEGPRGDPYRTRVQDELWQQPAPSIHRSHVYVSSPGGPESGRWQPAPAKSEVSAKQPQEFEHILSEIEQAVQETVEPEELMRRTRRRQHMTTHTDTRTETSSSEFPGERGSQSSP